MKVMDRMKNSLRTDHNWARGRYLVRRGIEKAPQGTLVYATDKFPIIGWLPRYNLKWLINDFIAGLTIGIMLIPQGLSYAKIATIPPEYGLMSSWFPSVVYAFMGTTKDLSTGPTSLIGLITSEIIDAVGTEQYTPQQIASAVAMSMGIYGIVIGFLRLGFLLDFISGPVLTGFISAVAITIILNQMDSLLGEDNVGDGAGTQIHDIFKQLPNANGYACAIGFTAIFFLTLLEKLGQRYGKKYVVLHYLSITRAFLCLVIYTGISFAVNKHRDEDTYLFEIAQVKANGLATPERPSGDLLSKVIARAVPVFIGAAIEHIAIARAFGVRNNYYSDSGQELCYFGVTNFFNSFFHSMGVGGAMSRTAVNSASNVKSPLSGFVTTAVILVCIYELMDTLYWIPKAALAAIIICAVWPLISHPRVFYKYWRTSFTDFIAAMAAFWVSLFVSTEYGIASSVAFSIVVCLLRQVFRRMSIVGADTKSELAASLEASHGQPTSIPPDTRVFRFNENFFFPNAHRNQNVIIDTIQVYHSGAYSTTNGEERERNWSVEAEQRIKRLRKHAQISGTPPPIRVVVLDFSRCNHTDVTACQNLTQAVAAIKRFAGDAVEIRFAGMSDSVRERFERGGFSFYDVESSDEAKPKSLGAYRTAADAVMARRKHELAEEVIDIELEKQAAAHVEKNSTFSSH